MPCLVEVTTNKAERKKNTRFYLSRDLNATRIITTEPCASAYDSPVLVGFNHVHNTPLILHLYLLLQKMESSPPPESQGQRLPFLDEVEYPVLPPNKKSVPFGVLVSLFERLQGEKKPEKRRKALASWFNVCLVFVCTLYLDCQHDWVLFNQALA